MTSTPVTIAITGATISLEAYFNCCSIPPERDHQGMKRYLND
jgi:hypothetical protein